MGGYLRAKKNMIHGLDAFIKNREQAAKKADLGLAMVRARTRAGSRARGQRYFGAAVGCILGPLWQILWG